MSVKPVLLAGEKGKMKIYNHVCYHPRSGKRRLTFYSSWQTHRKGLPPLLLPSSPALSFDATMPAVMDLRMQMIKSGGNERPQLPQGSSFCMM